MLIVHIHVVLMNLILIVLLDVVMIARHFVTQVAKLKGMEYLY